MEPATVLRIVTGLCGIFLLGKVFVDLAKRQLKEALCLVWGVVAVLLILIGFLPALSGWCANITVGTAVVVGLMGGALISGMYLMSKNISELLMKNQELAMQVSLLNQENERILYHLQQLTGKNKVDL